MTNKLTQEEFDKLERNNYGFIDVPAFTDLTEIKVFPNKCIFGTGCSFGEDCRFGNLCSFGGYCNFGKDCRFGKDCSFGEDYRFGKDCSICDHVLTHSHTLTMTGLDYSKRTLYLWKTKDGIYCQAGCFFGNKETFLQRVNKKYGENSDYEKAVNFLESLK